MDNDGGPKVAVKWAGPIYVPGPNDFGLLKL